MGTNNNIDFIKSHLFRILSLTRGRLPQSYMASALLLFVIIRRMECLFDPYRKKVLSIYSRDKDLLDEHDMDMRIRKVLSGNLNFYILTPSTMRDLLVHGYFQGVAGLEHYIRCFDRETADQLLGYGALDYANRLLFAKSFAPIINEICVLPLGTTMSREEFEEIVSWLVQMEALSGRQLSAERYSTTELSKIMSTLLLTGEKIKSGAKLYDPSCGTGNLIRTILSQTDVSMSIFGHEINSRIVCLSKLLTKTTSSQKWNIVEGDALTMDPFPDLYFDYVVADLPLQVEIQEAYRIDERRFPLGIPPSNKGIWLFIQHVIAKMAPRGKAVITCPQAIWYDESPYSNSVRTWMLNNDIIETMVSLPAGLTTSGNCICVLNKDKTKQKKNRVQIIRAESLFPNQKRRGIVLTDIVLESLSSTYSSFEDNDFTHWANVNDFFKTIIDVKQVVENDDTQSDNRGVKSQKTIAVTIPAGVDNIEEYINRNVVSHFDTGALIDWNSKRTKCIIDIKAPFEEVTEIRPVTAIKKDVANLRKIIESSFTNLFEENKHNHPVYSPEDFHPMQAILGSVVRITRSRTPLVRIGKKSKYPVLSPDYLRGYISEPKEYVESVSDNQIVRDGDILIMLDGENAGEVLRGKPGIISSTMIKVENITPAFDNDYLYYMLKAKEPELRLKTRGDFIKHLSLSDLRSLRIVIPSISFQITMARSLNPKIEAIDSLLPTIGGNARALLVEYRQALIQDAIASVTPVMN